MNKLIKNVVYISAIGLALSSCGEKKEDATSNEASTGNSTEATTKTGEATKQGYGGDVKVSLTLDEKGAISEVEVEAPSESEDIGGKALETLKEEAIGKTSGEEIEAVSGATMTSQAFKEAVDEAIKSAE